MKVKNIEAATGGNIHFALIYSGATNTVNISGPKSINTQIRAAINIAKNVVTFFMFSHFLFLRLS